MTLASTTVGLLFGISTYLILSRRMVDVAFGLVLLTNAINLLILVAASRKSPPLAPLLGKDVDALQSIADPLPQAFVLSAIFINLGFPLFWIALSLGIKRTHENRLVDQGKGENH